MDYDNDGRVSYEEFVPLCYEILKERMIEEYNNEIISTSADELEQYLLEIFESRPDANENKTLTLKGIKSALQTASQDSLGLTRLQIATISSEADVEPNGTVKYMPFIPVAARMIRNMFDASFQLERSEAIVKMAESEQAQLLKGFSRETVGSYFGKLACCRDTTRYLMLPHAKCIGARTNVHSFQGSRQRW